MTSFLVAARDVAPLPMWALWLPLVGVAIGGLLSAFGQWLAARSTHKAAEKMAHLAEQRELRQAEREAIHNLLVLVAATISRAHDVAADLPKENGDALADACDGAIEGITARQVECNAVAAQVDSTVADAALNAYEPWVRYFRMSREKAVQYPVDEDKLNEAAEAARTAQGHFHETTRARLDALDVRGK